jgi:hypothetical protein
MQYLLHLSFENVAARILLVDALAPSYAEQAMHTLQKFVHHDAVQHAQLSDVTMAYSRGQSRRARNRTSWKW